MDVSTIEARLRTLETTVAQIQRQLSVVPTSANWVDQVVGPVPDDEAFRKVLEYGRAWRNADRPADSQP